MRQIWIARKGPPNVLELREADDPEPAAGEVRIRVAYAGINFADLTARMGLYPDAPPIPCVVGYEVSGTVDALGDGPVFDEVVNALTARGVDQLAIFGFSHGGGSTFHLTERLAMTGGLGSYTVAFTSYTDGVENDGEFDTDQEDKLPVASGFHANHYQHGSFFQDLGLDGTAIPGSEPPPSGLDVETTPFSRCSASLNAKRDACLQGPFEITRRLTAVSGPTRRPASS